MVRALPKKSFALVKLGCSKELLRTSSQGRVRAPQLADRSFGNGGLKGIRFSDGVFSHKTPAFCLETLALASAKVAIPNVRFVKIFKLNINESV